MPDARHEISGVWYLQRPNLGGGVGSVLFLNKLRAWHWGSRHWKQGFSSQASALLGCSLTVPFPEPAGSAPTLTTGIAAPMGLSQEHSRACPLLEGTRCRFKCLRTELHPESLLFRKCFNQQVREQSQWPSLSCHGALCWPPHCWVVRHSPQHAGKARVPLSCLRILERCPQLPTLRHLAKTFAIADVHSNTTPGSEATSDRQRAADGLLKHLSS